jgi:hypothetical protein
MTPNNAVTSYINKVKKINKNAMKKLNNLPNIDSQLIASCSFLKLVEYVNDCLSYEIKGDYEMHTENPYETDIGVIKAYEAISKDVKSYINDIKKLKVTDDIELSEYVNDSIDDWVLDAVWDFIENKDFGTTIFTFADDTHQEFCQYFENAQ